MQRWLLYCLFTGLISVPVSAQTVGKPAPKASVSTNFLIVPGQSLGKIKLDMTRKEVTAILGNPSRERKVDEVRELVYTSKSSGNAVKVGLVNDQVAQIYFSSASYKTKEGIHVGTASENLSYLTPWKLHLRFVNVKYAWKKGGLTFYGLNVDSGDPEYPVIYWGVVHKGLRPVYEAQSVENEENGGWQPWNGEDIYSQ